MLESAMTLIISNEEINDIIKIIKSSESGLLIKDISETIENETKEKNWIFQYFIRYIGCQFIRKPVNS